MQNIIRPVIMQVIKICFTDFSNKYAAMNITIREIYEAIVYLFIQATGIFAIHHSPLSVFHDLIYIPLFHHEFV
jgi:hypothetical protein